MVLVVLIQSGSAVEAENGGGAVHCRGLSLHCRVPPTCCRQPCIPGTSGLRLLLLYLSCACSYLSSAAELRQELHWLPIYPSVEFKLLCHCSQRNLLWYTGLSCHQYQPSIVVRDVAIKHCSATVSTVHPSDVCKNSLFSAAVAVLWNRLPPSTHNIVTVTAFRLDSKTSHFNHAYTP